jgi:hypothetical protein
MTVQDFCGGEVGAGAVRGLARGVTGSRHVPCDPPRPANVSTDDAEALSVLLIACRFSALIGLTDSDAADRA